MDAGTISSSGRTSHHAIIPGNHSPISFKLLTYFWPSKRNTILLSKRRKRSGHVFIFLVKWVNLSTTARFRPLGRKLTESKEHKNGWDSIRRKEKSKNQQKARRSGKDGEEANLTRFTKWRKKKKVRVGRSNHRNLRLGIRLEITWTWLTILNKTKARKRKKSQKNKSTLLLIHT